MEAVLSLSMKLLLLFYQIRYSRESNRHSFGFQKRKTTNESMGEQPLSSGFSNYAKIRISRQIELHGVNNLVHLLVRKLACAGF